MHQPISRVSGVLLSLLVLAEALQQHSLATPSIHLHNKSSSKQVVFLITRAFDEVFAHRVIELADGVSHEKVDIWVMHTDPLNAYFQMPEALVAHLHAGTVQLKDNITAPVLEAWQTFGSEKSGYSKALFIQHALSLPEYDFYWQIEDDVALAGGKWSELFEAMAATYPSVSFLSGSLEDCHTGKFDQKQWETCHLPGGTTCELDGCFFKATWIVARFNRQYLLELAQALDDGLQGHHEVSGGTFCKANPSWCTVEALPSKVLGIHHSVSLVHPGQHCHETFFYAGGCHAELDCHKDKVTAKKIFCGEGEEGRLYHPVKSKYAAEVQQYCGQPDEEFCDQFWKSWGPEYYHENSAPNCSLTLTEQLSESICQRGASFGCVGVGTMYVENGCRGQFRCNGKSLTCSSMELARKKCPC